MAGVGHVGVDATVSAVSAAALLGSLVDLDVLDNQVRGVEAFGIGIGFGILEEVEEEAGRLDGVAGLGNAEVLACKFSVSTRCSHRWAARLSASLKFCDSHLFVMPFGNRILRTLRAAACAASISSHGDNLFEFLDILEVLDRTLNLPAIDGLSSLSSVLEADTQVRAPGAGRLRRSNVLRSVADLHR